MSTPAERFVTSQIPPPPASCAGFLYRVQPGDSMFVIARPFNVSLQSLITANPLIPKSMASSTRFSPGIP